MRPGQGHGRAASGQPAVRRKRRLGQGTSQDIIANLGLLGHLNAYHGMRMVWLRSNTCCLYCLPLHAIVPYTPLLLATSRHHCHNLSQGVVKAIERIWSH